jgi:hypothetical protein
MELAAVIFAAAALGGVGMAFFRLTKNINPPTWLALVHGAAGALGLVLLIMAILNAETPGYEAMALALFLAAALGGFYLFSHHMRGQLLPENIIFIHGGVAVVAFVTLLASMFMI